MTRAHHLTLSPNWDHKIAQEIRTVLEFFAEVVDEPHIVAPWARLKVEFTLPTSSRWFELKLPGERTRQTVVVPG